MRVRAHSLVGWIVLGLLFASITCLCSCSRSTNTPISIVDGKTLSQYQVTTSMPRGVAASQVTYAEVDSTKLAAYYTHFLSVFGLATGQNAPHWDANANCTAFAGLYADLAKCEYYALEFRSFTGGATAPAIGTVWYAKGGKGAGHAIDVVITEKGRTFIEPQTGKEVTLTPAEFQSAWQVQY